MSHAGEGSKVVVHFTGKLKDGSVVDTSREREPLTLTIGEGRFIPGFESAIVGMEPGEEKTATIPAVDAFGEFRQDLVIEIPKSEFPDNAELELGQKFTASDPGAGSVTVTVIELKDESAIVDANHELAGKDLVFDIELLEIVA